MLINKCLKRFSHYLDRLPKLGSKLGVIPLDFLGFDLAILDLQKLNHLPPCNPNLHTRSIASHHSLCSSVGEYSCSISCGLVEESRCTYMAM